MFYRYFIIYFNYLQLLCKNKLIVNNNKNYNNITLDKSRYYSLQQHFIPFLLLE